VVFLASDDAAYINAATLMVDGGATVYMGSTSSPTAANDRS
jgi:NAD(P)-dependent dehydrogenase (short-subunit alcohol dehydrogenase family)